MASKSFALNTEPHVAEIGQDKLSFLPEVTGPEFADAYTKLRDVQTKAKAIESGGKASSSKPAKSINRDDLVALTEATRGFIAEFLLDDDEKSRFEGMRIPDRILAQLMEWIVELYGGGSGNGDDGGQSSD